ncbi:Type 1 glutamine amidotransferase-like domain-containing protein [Macrococcus sp. DPC7161]|uniref:Type 1 glutamine amidotransferase-like domain-containing protein n=1 Tax=Macrococcus sp. DPC7161 TaxID=2507060 RepID=UPI00100B6F73|nr:Type 1 glutamine amidotransferase-like domain-containing protein [Macrococcus sp. DPC7161]RXK17461.1 peptidase S51 [Macrococcus sp. DPC7161]
MINILLSLFKEKSNWNSEIERYIKGKIVLIIPFSFTDKYVTNEKEWKNIYGVGGKFYQPTIDPLLTFGVEQEAIRWINYYQDSIDDMKQEIQNAEVIFFTGGAPELMMQRLIEKDLVEVIQAFNGVVVGYSAGAMVQLNHYHITPDEDYPSFSYERGLNLVSGFDIEVHYEPYMDPYNEKVVKEKGVKVFALTDEGMLIVRNGEVEMYGDIKIFE